MGPVGVEQGRGGAVGQAEGVVYRPGPPLQKRIQPRVGRLQLGAGLGNAVGIGWVCLTDRIKCDRLQWRGDVAVEEAIQQPHVQHRGRVIGNQRYRAGMCPLQVLDDDAGFHPGAPAIDRHRKAPQQPAPRQLGTVVGKFPVQHPEFERRAVFVPRDQHLLAIGRKGRGEQLQRHASPRGAHQVARFMDATNGRAGIRHASESSDIRADQISGVACRARFS
jgi:hypothetical protein